MDARKGQWVEIVKIILSPAERAPSLPQDTQRVPFEARLKGFLENDAYLGDTVEIHTVIGRRVSGTLIRIEPAYSPTFGAPVPELLTIGQELRALLSDEGGQK